MPQRKIDSPSTYGAYLVASMLARIDRLLAQIAARRSAPSAYGCGRRGVTRARRIGLVLPSWTHVSEYVFFLAVCVAGILNASWLCILIGAILLLGWSRYRDLFAHARKVDATDIQGDLDWPFELAFKATATDE